MRLLPDMHFRTNVKKRYEANYDKITAWRQERANERSAKRLSAVEKRQRIVGGVVFAIILAFVLIFGLCLANLYTDKEQTLHNIQNEIQSLDDEVKAYQTIASEEREAQLIDAVDNITLLQNQYLADNRDSNFEALTARYLGRYAVCWCNKNKKVKQNWVGYLDLSDGAKGVFVLSENNIPTTVVVAELETDASGNFTKITDITRTEFV